MKDSEKLSARKWVLAGELVEKCARNVVEICEEGCTPAAVIIIGVRPGGAVHVRVLRKVAGSKLEGLSVKVLRRVAELMESEGREAGGADVDVSCLGEGGAFSAAEAAKGGGSWSVGDEWRVGVSARATSEAWAVVIRARQSRTWRADKLSRMMISIMAVKSELGGMRASSRATAALMRPSWMAA